jgi:hypothetical protein
VTPTAAQCQARADEKLAEAERDPQHRQRHRNAAEAWAFLAKQLREADAAQRRAVSLSSRPNLMSRR